MTTLAIGKAITSIVSFATITVALVFGNFLLRRADASVLGVMLPARLVHFILGPTLLFLNAFLFVFLCAFYRTSQSSAEIAELQRLQKYKFLGPLLNPFYAAGGTFANMVGYAFLIVLWWLGMYSFAYSVGLSPSADGPWLFGWQALVSVLYLALGLGSMVAIQACWYKLGISSYQPKVWASFVGIAVGAFVPPILLRQGIPPFPFPRKA